MSRSVLTLSGSQVLGLSVRCSRTMRAESVFKRETSGKTKPIAKLILWIYMYIAHVKIIICLFWQVLPSKYDVSGSRDTALDSG